MPAFSCIDGIVTPACEQVHGERRRGVHSNDEQPARLDSPVAHVDAVVAIDRDRVIINHSRNQLAVDVVCRAVERQAPRDAVDASAERSSREEFSSDERLMLGIDTSLPLSVIKRVARMQ
ncbi:MAG: hypothetical protein ACXVHJ_32495 [Solirubrobacteraceae bacterium]